MGLEVVGISEVESSSMTACKILSTCLGKWSVMDEAESLISDKHLKVLLLEHSNHTLEQSILLVVCHRPCQYKEFSLEQKVVLYRLLVSFRIR